MSPIEGDAFRESSRCGRAVSVSFLARLWPFQAHRAETERAYAVCGAAKSRPAPPFSPATTVDSSRAGRAFPAISRDLACHSKDGLANARFVHHRRDYECIAEAPQSPCR
jgi:hypothetical protein